MTTSLFILVVLIASCIGFRAGYHWRGRPSGGSFVQRWTYRYDNEYGLVFARWKKR